MKVTQSKTEKKYLIVNADDFGRSAGVNRGIIKAHEQGIVTSASVMVRWPDAADAAAYGRTHSDLSLGLHLDLYEWSYVSGKWISMYEVVSLDDTAAAEAEVLRQLDLFRSLVGAEPTHLDSHQHCHMGEPMRSICQQVADKLRIPLRACGPAVSYCGDFYGQTGTGLPYPEGIAPASLMQSIAALPCGITEFGCHPGEDEKLDSMYRDERAREVETLCDPGVRSSIAGCGIELISFRDVTSDSRLMV